MRAACFAIVLAACGRLGFSSTPDAVACNGADLANDTNNCGACGHSCLGGACSAGVCQPALVAGDPTQFTGLKSLYGIAVVGSELIGTDWYQPASGLVYRVPAAGYTLQAQFVVGVPADSDGSGVGIVSDGARVFYASYRSNLGVDTSRIYAANLDGSGNQTLYTLGYLADAVAVDGTYLYWWWQQGSGFNIGDKLGNVINSPVASDAMCNVAADGTGTIFFAKNGVVVRAQASAPDMQVSLGSGGGTPNQIALDGAFAYWLDTTAHRLWRAPRAGGGPVTEVTPPGGFPAPYPRSLFALDPTSSSLFYVSMQVATASDGSAIFRACKDGSCPAVKIADLADGVSAIAQDASSIYWTSYGNDPVPAAPYSAIYRLAK